MPDDEELDALFERAADLRRAGKFEEALPLFERLYSESPTFAVCLLLADVLGELGSLERSSELFKQATTMRPQSEPASVALFHSLRDQGRRDEAIEEMRRYLAVKAPNAYVPIQRLIDEGKI